MSIENVRGLMSDLPVSTLATTGASTQVRPEESTSESPKQTTTQTTGFATVLALAVPIKSGTPQTAKTDEKKIANPASAAATADRPATTRTTGCCRSHEEEGMSGDFGGLATNFSFFVRVSGNAGQIGRETMSRFHQAAEEVTSTFLTEAGWTSPGSISQGLTADPVNAFLQGSETALLKGSDQFNGFLDEIRNAVQEGLQPLIGALSRNQPLFAGIPASFSPSVSSVTGYGSGASGASSSAAPALPGPVSAEWTIAQLRLSQIDMNSLKNQGTTSTGSTGSSTGTSLTTASSRPPVYNREGQILIKVDRPSDATTKAPLVIAAANGSEQAPVTTPNNGRTDQVMRAFLGKFLDFIESFREDLENPDTHTSLAQKEAVATAVTAADLKRTLFINVSDAETTPDDSSDEVDTGTAPSGSGAATTPSVAA